MNDLQRVRDASTALHLIALWLDLQGDRMETLDTWDDEVWDAVLLARALKGDA